jgi:gluconate 2-dehydrogenase gamma chain
VRTLSRREILASGAAAFATLAFGASTSTAAIIKGEMPMSPGRAYPPTTPMIGNWHFFTDAEGAAIEAIMDRLIPADANSPGGKDMGCAIYLDRQLAGPYGSSEGFYMSGPFQSGTPQQGPQTAMTPAKKYRQALAAIDRYCRANFAGKSFVQLEDAEKDKMIAGMEEKSIALEGIEAHDVFQQVLKDTQEGFFADPIYGGNVNMASWKMIGFPGARYDYRDWVSRHNEPFPLGPVGMADHPDWTR